MLKFWLESSKSNEYEFVYIPEGNYKDTGTVIWDRTKNEARVGRKADGDEYTVYARHLMKNLREEYAARGTLPKSGIVAWY